MLMGMRKGNQRQLEALLSYCKELALDIQYYPEHRYFTATALAGATCLCGEDAARELQKKIQCESGRYAALVCYCFDSYSTLVYSV